MPTPAASRPPRLLGGLLFALALAFAASYVGLALLRMTFPFELEWIEGGSLAMAHRFVEGLPLYVAPSLRYVPFNYPPLYFWLGSFALWLGGDGFAPLRAISLLASLACGAILYRYVVVETGRRAGGLLAACLFFATYRLSGSWLDVARTDSLHLAFLLGGFLVLRADPSRIRGPVIAAALITLAFLTKQSAAVAVAPLAAVLVIRDRARGIAFGAALLGLTLASVLALDASSGGWFRYYAFALAGHYSVDPALIADFWARGFFGPLAVAVLAGVLALLLPVSPAPPRSRDVTWAALAGLVLASWSVRAYPAAFDNVLMPACAAAALAFGFGWSAALGAAENAGGERGARILRFAHVASILQFVTLLYNPLAQLPGRNDAADGARLVDGLRRVPGTVLVPCHPFMTARAGKGEHFHEMAYAAVAKSGTDTTATRLRGQWLQALRERRWGTIVLDKADWLWAEVEDRYRPEIPVFPDDKEFWPVTGMRRRPEVIFVPKPDSAAVR